MQRIMKAGGFALTVLAAAASVAGLRFAATNPETGWSKWGIGGLSLAVLSFIAYLVWPAASEWAKRVRNYPKLEQAAGIAIENYADARRVIDGFPVLLRAEREEGRREMYGSILANAGNAALEPIGLFVGPHGLVIGVKLTAGSMPMLGSRYVLRTQNFGTERGVLEVVEVCDELRANLQVVSMSSGSESFWESATRSAESNEVAPPHLELVPDPQIHERLKNMEENSD